MRTLTILTLFFALLCAIATAQHKPRFKALAIAETGGGHAKFDSVAKIWLNKLAIDSNFTIDYITDTKPITKAYLSQYQLFIQLDYPPYPWGNEAQQAFKDYIKKGKGGWIGFHHPTLLGVFDGYPMWRWYSRFMGHIQFENYIPGGATATLNVEDASHPAMQGLPYSFATRDQWYTYNKSPRGHVHVLASIDENTYPSTVKVKMGDHPVVWTNQHVKARNIYIAMGHYTELLSDPIYTNMVRNALFWAVGK
ncbi:ThuA domain-containing protein [Mucilaginibacter mali]|uniref:ThuA domain-containing protein n=1 Tax=Mucilaginibacter mali TaxID=2740462 RepID=A0A7D4Q0M2_9SPHI|nr:ThuA domain-containing protein [Mucilaginibacter mali]QKJ29906.1 ThuA domain-containing protein [Mucilaginibacter mali]